jgi:hypothetical protein
MEAAQRETPFQARYCPVVCFPPVTACEPVTAPELPADVSPLVMVPLLPSPVVPVVPGGAGLTAPGMAVDSFDGIMVVGEVLPGVVELCASAANDAPAMNAAATAVTLKVLKTISNSPGFGTWCAAIARRTGGQRDSIPLPSPYELI